MTRCDVVIATRNRPPALELTVPLWAREIDGRGRLLLVDSSDDHAPVAELGRRQMATGRSEVVVVRGPVGLTKQRNVGLGLVDSPVVICPDDDSVPLPGAVDAILNVYDRDLERRIGAVCAAESPVAPDQVVRAAQRYRMGAGDRLKQQLAHARSKLERRLAPDPFIIHGRSRWGHFTMPAWADREDVVPVEWMTGFRMSFRTEVIRRIGFNESMSHYGLFEDVDASFGVWRSHLVVGARRARVFHQRFPGARSAPLLMGATQILNRAYVICRHTDQKAEARRALLEYGRYKIAQYALVSWKSGFDRLRLRGALNAQRCVPALLRASQTELDIVYFEALSEATGQ